MDMILRYYSDADVLVIRLREGRVHEEEMLDNDIILGYNEDGDVVRVEILDSSKKGLINVLHELIKSKRDIVEHLLRRAMQG